MKKLITTPKQSEIHIDDLHAYCVILVHKQGKIIGAIQRDSLDQVICNIPSTRTFFQNEDNNLSELLKHDKLKDCEFYVLD